MFLFFVLPKCFPENNKSKKKTRRGGEEKRERRKNIKKNYQWLNNMGSFILYFDNIFNSNAFRHAPTTSNTVSYIVKYAYLV